MTTQVLETPAETTEAAPQATEAESEVPSDVAEFIASRETKDEGTGPEKEPVQDSPDAELDAAIDAAAAVKADKLATDKLAAQTAEAEAKTKAQATIDRQQRVSKDYENRITQVEAAVKDLKAGEISLDAMPLTNGRTVHAADWFLTQFKSHHAQQETAFFEAQKISMAEHLPEAERESFINRINPKTPEEALKLYGDFVEAVTKKAQDGYFSEAEVKARETKALVAFRNRILAGTPAEVEARLATMRSQVRTPQAIGMTATGGGMTKEQFKSLPWQEQDKFATEHPARFAKIYADGQG